MKQSISSIKHLTCSHNNNLAHFFPMTLCRAKFFSNSLIVQAAPKLNKSFIKSSSLILNKQNVECTLLKNYEFNQVRGFLPNPFAPPTGNAAGIKYVEQRIIGFSPEQVYSVVSNVNDYKLFLPNVKDSAFIKNGKETVSEPDKDGLVEKSSEAYLTVGFPPFVETYTSTVTLKEPVSVRAVSQNMKLFNKLSNYWTIAEGPAENTCRLTFHVDFEFSSKLYQHVANMFFDFCKFYSNLNIYEF